MTSNDLLAAGLISEAWKHGKKVPDDLAVLGFDNQPIAHTMGITTIQNPLYQLGSQSFNLLYALIKNPGQLQIQHELSFELVIRSTT